MTKPKSASLGLGHSLTKTKNMPKTEETFEAEGFEFGSGLGVWLELRS